MAERFYVKDSLEPGPYQLQGSEAHHLARVCRIRPGNQIYLFNGDGHQYPATVQEVSKRCVDLRIDGQERPERELPFSLEIAAPLPKGDRASFLVEKLTELGVTTLTLLRTARTVVYPGEAKIEKLERTVIESSKQCGRNVLMEIKPLVEWETYCRSSSRPTDLRWIAHPQTGKPLPGLPTRDLNSVTLAVGPEGGFADHEVTRALDNGWRPLDLGPRTLRVETAAIAAATYAIFAAGPSG